MKSNDTESYCEKTELSLADDHLYQCYTQKAQEAESGAEQQNYIQAAEKRLLKLQAKDNRPIDMQ